MFSIQGSDPQVKRGHRLETVPRPADPAWASTKSRRGQCKLLDLVFFPQQLKARVGFSFQFFLFVFFFP